MSRVVVVKDHPGFSVYKNQTKMALRVVQNLVYDPDRLPTFPRPTACKLQHIQ